MFRGWWDRARYPRHVVTYADTRKALADLMARPIESYPPIVHPDMLREREYGDGGPLP